MEVQSRLLSRLNFDPGILVYLSLFLTTLCLIIMIIIFMRQNILNTRYHSFMRGKSGKSIEELLHQRIEDLDKLKENDMLVFRRMKDLEKSVQRSYQKCGIVKYDAFKEMGGKMSFAYAMLNNEDSGYIINAIHSREGCYTYIKEIIKGESFLPLSEEEQEAFDQARMSDGTIAKKA